MENQQVVRTALLGLALQGAEQAQAAPVVVVQGYGGVAEAIMLRARDHGLFVHASPDLVKLLMHVDLDQQIPPQLYRAVAELLAWTYALEQPPAPLQAV